MMKKKRLVVLLFCVSFALGICFGGYALSFAAFSENNATERVPVEKTAFASGGYNDGLVETYRSDVAAKNAPTVVCDVTDKTTLDSLTAGDERPSNAILRLDADCNVTGAGGEILGSFKDVYANILQGKIIPVLYLKDGAAASAAIRFLSEDTDILDLAVMSDTPSIIKTLREFNNKIRGIISYAANADLYDVVKTTNENYANVAVLPQSAASAKNVRYVHARFKTVWVTANSSDEMTLRDCINSGAYGVIASDFGAVYGVLRTYGENDLFRAPFNVAHRGLPKQCNENSVSGALAAAASGATHVELDGWITTDNEIMLLHDGLLDRTTTGTGHIENYSAAELKQFTLTLDAEPIPSLTDAIRALKDTRVIIVFEIKTKKPEIVARLKQVLNEENCYDRLVVISFETSILALMKELLPEVPTANLNSCSASTFKTDLLQLGELNTGVDCNSGTVSPKFNEYYLRDRGFVGWYWTYDNRSLMNRAVECGYVGITNNEADSYANNLMLVEGAQDHAEKLERGDKITLKVTTFAGAVKQAEGVVTHCVDKGDGWEVTALYNSSRNTYHTQRFWVRKGAQKKGCGSLVEPTASGAATLTFLLGAVCLIIRRRKKTA